jgi:hypothetical protein
MQSRQRRPSRVARVARAGPMAPGSIAGRRHKSRTCTRLRETSTWTAMPTDMTIAMGIAMGIQTATTNGAR